jgi:hypothetical protein
MDEPTVRLSLSDRWTANGDANGDAPGNASGGASGGADRTFHAQRVICGQHTLSLVLGADRRTSYPRAAVKALDVDDEVDIVRSGNPR